MTHPAAFTPHRPPGRGWKTTIGLCLVIIMAISGCAPRQLNVFKTHAAAGQYQWIADQQVDCTKDSDVCGQLHLLRGDACFRLAKAATSAPGNYTCAADELEKGLSLNHAWDDAAAHQQFQENLCEALRNLQDQQSGQAAAGTLKRLVKAAQELDRLAPDSVPAIYYLAKAHLRQVQPMVIDIDEATQAPVCNQLKRSLTSVQSKMEAAKHGSVPQWSRFAENYRQLASDLGTTMQAAQCP